MKSPASKNSIVALVLVLFILSCQKQKSVTITFDGPDDTDSTKFLKNIIIINFIEAEKATIRYKNGDALAYANQYALQNNNSCGIYNNNPTQNLSDCAHFIAHCLKAGGIEIKPLVPNLSICAHGLSYRVAELTSALKNLSAAYSNVTAIKIDEAIVGDYGFFKNPLRPTHAFMICQPAANTDNLTIYAHSTNRNCSKPEPGWLVGFDISYRITDNN